MDSFRYTPGELASNLGGSITEARINDESIRELTVLSNVDKALIVGDVHLGYDDVHNPEKFSKFINQEVRKVDPDLFIINGDFLEFWRSSIETVLTEYREQVSDVLSLVDQRDVALIAGNHDYRVYRIESGILVSEGIKFQNGDKQFKVIHGHNYDPRNSNNYTNEGLCLTSSETGDAADKWWDVVTDILPFTVTTNRSRFGLPDSASPFGPVQHLSDPEILSKPSQSQRAETIKKAIKADNEAYTIYGHTHMPFVGDEVANAGSFTSDELTYIVVEDGEVDLRRF